LVRHCPCDEYCVPPECITDRTGASVPRSLTIWICGNAMHLRDCFDESCSCYVSHSRKISKVDSPRLIGVIWSSD